MRIHSDKVTLKESLRRTCDRSGKSCPDHGRVGTETSRGAWIWQKVSMAVKGGIKSGK